MNENEGSVSTEKESFDVIANKYQIVGKIGSGSFGEIFLARNMRTGEDVAVKVENAVIVKDSGASKRSWKSQLKREAKVYAKMFGEVGIPKLRWLGLSEAKNWMVMDLLGRSLEDLFNYCGRKFSIKTVTVIACELICRIETIHNKGKLVHRDIKPENFLMGRGRDRHTVFIVDFGLAKLFQNPRTGRHIPMKEGYSLTGTARYASINAHLGHELSRRDDLLSIGYVLVYFLKGSLPWQGLQGDSHEEKYLNILTKKQETSLEELCQDLPGNLYFMDYFGSCISILLNLCLSNCFI
jgi:serine/threonine protein kinase